MWFEINYHNGSPIESLGVSDYDYDLANDKRFEYTQFYSIYDDNGTFTYSINFKDKKSRLFASRGQQKLIVSLLKIAQVTFLASRRGPSLFLLDDFMTDLDENRAQLFLPILDNLEGQVFFTSPLKKGHMDSLLSQKGAQKVLLTIWHYEVQRA